jgi:dihydroorotase
MREAKESACGCAGIFNAPYALESYARVFEEEGALGAFEAFASEHGARFYGLSLDDSTVTLQRVDHTVPAEIDGVVPFHAGETLRWQMVAGKGD